MGIVAAIHAADGAVRKGQALQLAFAAIVATAGVARGILLPCAAASATAAAGARHALDTAWKEQWACTGAQWLGGVMFLSLGALAAAWSRGQRAKRAA